MSQKKGTNKPVTITSDQLINDEIGEYGQISRNDNRGRTES